MEDVGVGLDDHQLVDLDRAVLADPAEVVAAEVDEHHVLGALLGVLEQALGARRSSSSSPARVGAGDRPGLDAAPVTLTRGSGEAPAISKSPKSRKYM